MGNDRTTPSSDRDATGRRGGDQSAERFVPSDRTGYVGDTITFHGRNLPAEQTFDIEWQSVQGGWGVIKANEVMGPQFQPRTETIATVTTDESGRFEEEWTVHEDYGGAHVVELKTDGERIDTAQFEITPWFELGREQAPMGETFVVSGYGLGPKTTRNNYQVTWDNGYVGFMTAVLNRGTATARIRAAGPPGEHVIQIWRNYQGIPYLSNNTQSPLGPVAGGRQSAWTVEVTEPDEPPRTSWCDRTYEESPIALHYPELDADTGAELEITPPSGQPGTDAFITGENFPPDAQVDLLWYEHVGESRRGPDIFPEPRRDVLPTVTTDGDGWFRVEVEIPQSEGSTRPIVAEIDGQTVAVTGFMMQPNIATFSPTSGPVGTEIEIELSGIGWTTYENSPFFTYDNKMLGYAAETADEGSPTVRTVIRASGEPGYHFIDVYPSIATTKEDETGFERKPHLSYSQNHPVRSIPACHLTFEVTE